MAKNKKSKTRKTSRAPTAVQTNRQFEVEDAARTLMRTEEIRADKVLLGAAKRELGKQQKALTRAIKKV